MRIETERMKERETTEELIRKLGRLVNGKYRPFGNAALLERGVFLLGEEIDAPIYDMLTDESRIAKASHLVCEASRNDRQLAVFWRRWCWKGAFLTSFED